MGIDEEELREHPRSVPKTLRPAEAPGNSYESNDRLKVLGMAECGPDGWSLWNGDVIDMVDRPANLRGVPGAYAVYVVGASMEPRYHPGELVHIHPGKPAHHRRLRAGAAPPQGWRNPGRRDQAA